MGAGESDMSGTLYLVATPIGNLSDISARAVQTLQAADFIAAEDTRVTRKLLGHLGVKKPLISYYKHNSRESGDKILNEILEGKDCALVTDAGTPGISDPGEDLVRLCIKAGVQVINIPGPCAAIAGLTLSGLPCGRFTFEGFPPAEKKKRLKYLSGLKDEERTMVFYEAPHKLKRTLADMLDVLGDRRVSVSREMTKLFEETLRMTLSEAASHFADSVPRGEFVLVVEGAHDSPLPAPNIDDAVAAALALIKSGLSTRDAVKKAAGETGCSKNELYKAVMTCAADNGAGNDSPIV